MTLPQLLSADLATLRHHALVFDTTLAGALSAKWSEHGNTNCVPMPMTLTDGRLMLCADVLTEVGPGGLLEGMWAAADKAVLAQEVEVMPMAEVVALLPAEPSPV
jgi:hypothetical protein